MSRLLWWLVLALGAWWLIKRLRADRAGTDQPARPGPAADAGRTGPLVMVRCAHCGVHLPQADAVLDEAQRAYCSAAHLAAGPR